MIRAAASTPIKKEQFLNSKILYNHNLHQYRRHTTDFDQPRMRSVKTGGYNVTNIVALTKTDLTLKMAFAKVVETSVANNSFSQDSNYPDDLFQ